MFQCFNFKQFNEIQLPFFLSFFGGGKPLCREPLRGWDDWFFFFNPRRKRGRRGGLAKNWRHNQQTTLFSISVVSLFHKQAKIFNMTCSAKSYRRCLQIGYQTTDSGNLLYPCNKKQLSTADGSLLTNSTCKRATLKSVIKEWTLKKN